MEHKDKQIVELESEIRYLRQLLDENGIKYDYKEYIANLQKKAPTILMPELTTEHAIKFYSYFHGRKDVYVKRSPKKGYYTQCNNFWKHGVCPKVYGDKIKCQDCQSKDYTILNTEAILDHLRGKREDCSDVIGLYPLFPDGTCWFLVFDFDNHDEEAKPSKDWQQEVDAMRQICKSTGIDALVERSRSGLGAHLWIFFSEAVSASKARKFGEALLAKGAESVNLKSFRYYDRMMPMQDILPDGKLGNLIALPLQGKALRQGNSVFVDENWIPYENQWGTLLNIRKLSNDDISNHINLWCPDNDTMGLFSEIEEESEDSKFLLFTNAPKTSLYKFTETDASGTIKIVLADGIYIDSTNLKPRLQNAIRRLAAYTNPQFYQNLALGFSNKDTPRIVYNGYDDGNYIVIPRGCLDKLIEHLSQSTIPYNIVDKRQLGNRVNVEFNGELYPEQKIAAEHLLSYENGILAAATAFGKTVIGAYLIAERKVNTLVLVHNVEIMNNWIRDLNQFLTIKEDKPEYTTPKGRIKRRNSVIGTFSSQKDTTTGIIDVAMITSLGKDDDISPIVKNYGMVIIDECHHAAAVTHANVLRSATAKYIYGMTATAKRGDKQDKKLIMLLGPIRHRYTAKERALKQGIGHYVYPRFTRLLDIDSSKDKHISDYYRMIIQSGSRNLLIIKDTIECVHKGRTPIIMTKYREHAEVLYHQLQGAAQYVFLLQGGNSMKARAQLREKMLAVSKTESMVVVAIGQYIGEGFNYPRLDTMLMAMPISFEGNVEQYAGRLNRDYEGKKDVIIFDYIDQNIPTLERMYHRRLRTYKKIGFEVCSQILDKQTVNNSIFDSENYRAIFSKDIITASKNIIISSPSLGFKQTEWIITHSVELQLKGVTISVFTLCPNTYHEDGREHHTKLINNLSSAGIQVKAQEICHERYAIIDQSIVWYGSINLLSNTKDDDNIMRIISPSIAEELMELSIKNCQARPE